MSKNNIKSIEWAIDNNFITNYNIIVINDDEYDLDKSILSKYNNKFEIIISAYVALKALYDGISKKILIYCNRVENAKMVQNIINDLIKIKNGNKNELNTDGIELNIGNYELNGSNCSVIRNDVIAKFKEDEYGILSSVQIFGEGFDYPELDSVLFAEKMSSPIRIVQSALRPCRINTSNKNKVANIFLPVTKNDKSKLKQFLLKMKSVDNIVDKIKISKLGTRRNVNLNRNSNENVNRNEDVNLDIDALEYLSYIKLEYLRNELEEINLNKTYNIEYKKLFKSDDINVILCPVSDTSFINYYKTILSRDIQNENCSWGLKFGLKSQWKKLKKDDYICLVEKHYITIGIVQKTYESKPKSIENWNDDIYLNIIEFRFFKRIKIQKKEFMVKIGCKPTDNLMGSRVYNGKHKNVFLEL